MAEIELQRADRVLRIHLNRPEKRNALTAEMYLAIADALADAADDPEIGCILVTAAGDHFTAGNDIGDLLSRPPGGEGGGVERFLEGLVAQPKPLVAAVQGAAVGVGTTMLMHCDLVVAADTAVFSSPFTALGLVPEAASTYLMPLMVGYRRAAALLMAGEAWSAAGALEAGLVSHVRPRAEVEATALDLARLLAARPAGAMSQTKALMRAGFRDATVTQVAREAEAFTATVRSPEARAAFQTFLKR